MANKEHLDILKKGVPAWNKWRENNQKIQPDLSETNLSGADLVEAKLVRTNLYCSNLFRTSLHGAYLDGANLTGANLAESFADSQTIWPAWFDPLTAGVIIED